jgi:hypothetical protein
MSQEKYIGMDVHQATISVAVMDAGGKLIMECILETRAATILEFIQGLHGTLSLTFEEGTISPIKARTAEFGEALFQRFVLCAKSLRQVEPFGARNVLELVICFAVIVHHALTEFLDLVARSPFHRQPPKFHFRKSALCGLANEFLVTRRQGGGTLTLSGSLVRLDGYVS